MILDVLQHVLTIPVGLAAVAGYAVGNFMGRRATDHYRSS